MTAAGKKDNMPRLQKLYREQFTAELLKELNLGNINEVPSLEKIIVSVGLGKNKDDKRVIEAATNTLAKITAQQPVLTKARKSIANFKLREGQKIGLKVTLRAHRMYEFTDRLFNLTLPRLRDFRGLSLSAFDSQGNYHLGLADQSAFPELTFEETTVSHGMQVTFVIKAKNSQHAKALLQKLGLPFEKGRKEN